MALDGVTLLLVDGETIFINALGSSPVALVVSAVVVESVKDGDVDAEGEAICINGVGAMPDEVNR